MSHNWSATKQRLHPQSVAKINCHSVLSGDRTRVNNMRHRLGLATRTQISVCKSPFPSAGTSVSLFRAKTVQQRPLLPREVEIRLSDCTSWELTIWADFQLCLHRLLMSTGCKSSHNAFLDVSRSNGGLRISWYHAGLANCYVWRFSPPACQWQPSFVGLAVQCWRALEAMGEV